MNWIVGKWYWAKQNPLFWCNVFLWIITVGIIFFWKAANASDFRVRTLGMLFQLIGVGTVWFDLTAAARKFGKPGSIISTLKWLKAGLFGRSVVIAVSGAAMGCSTGRARITVRATILPTASVRDRLLAIEKNLGKIDEDIHAAFAEISRTESEMKAQILNEANERTKVVTTIRDDLEDLTNGNSTVLSFGLLWLAIGIVLSTWASEIAKIAAGNWRQLVGVL